MATSEVVSVEIENLTRVERDVYYMRTTAGNMRVYGNRVVADIVNTSKKAFRDSIQKYVYSVAPTTYDRTGDLGRGVRSRNFSKGLAAGEIYMDPNILGENGYFYPDAVEWGLNSKPTYWGRHYWSQGKAVALAQFRYKLFPYANEMAHAMLGR